MTTLRSGAIVADPSSNVCSHLRSPDVGFYGR